MKKTILTIGVFVLALILSGCENKDTEKTFEATILECKENSMIVKPDESESEYKSSEQFSISFVGNYNSCEVDGKVKITYKGDINESFPAQIDTVKIEDIK